MILPMTSRALGEGRWIFAVLGLGWLLTLSAFPLLALGFAVLIVFSICFFRDPERRPPADESLAVAPADGLVVEVAEVDEAEFLNRRVRRVTIFLSIFDVHVNRSPIAGRITVSQPAEGTFLDARRPESSAKNARRTWIIEGAAQSIAVRQITGAVARRICAWKHPGDSVQRGERFGMIRFGSRTEADFPMGAEVLVKVGDRVLGGSTAIARLPGSSS